MKSHAGKTRVLIVEDDDDIRDLVRYNLERDGFAVDAASDGESAIQKTMGAAPDLVVLDVMLPGMSGLDVCRHLRRDARTERTPIILVTARGEESDRVVGLELGADDYVTKPFSVRELLARVRAVLRRSQLTVAEAAEDDACVRLGPLVIDPDRHQVTCDGRPVLLTLAEFKLLRALAAAPGRVLTRDHLLDHITGGDVVVIDRNVDVHVRAIRKKLGEHAGLVTTVRGVGYKCMVVEGLRP